MLSALAAGLLPASATPAAAEDFVVVAHKALGVSAVTSAELEAIFLGKMSSWSSGEKVTIAILDEDATLEKFLSKHVHKTASQFNNYWKQMVFTGKAGMPDTFKTPAEVISFVGSHPGAISFVPAAAGDGSVKTLTVN
jgi:ABC-type phosphate transport system substrate-binding protein